MLNRARSKPAPPEDPPASPPDVEACRGCGLTRQDLYARGQMGCAECYRTFEAEVRRALREIHGAHIGSS